MSNLYHTRDHWSTLKPSFHIIVYDGRRSQDCRRHSAGGSHSIALDRWFVFPYNRTIAVNRRIAEKCFHIIAQDRRRSPAIVCDGKGYRDLWRDVRSKLKNVWLRIFPDPAVWICVEPTWTTGHPNLLYFCHATFIFFRDGPLQKAQRVTLVLRKFITLYIEFRKVEKLWVGQFCRYTINY